ncbi:MAG: hypothetical protein WKF83_02740 [Nocardioidaceae bacterium]
MGGWGGVGRTHDGLCCRRSFVCSSSGSNDDVIPGGESGEATAFAGAPVGTARFVGGQAEAEAEAEPKPRGTVIRTAASDFGEMLFDRSGQAIYLFEKESTKRARCYGACAEAWPPVLTKGEPRASAKTRQGLLGTTRRNDGSTQVTYAGHPLYFYVNEGKNEVLCHNVNQFGALWLVVTPGGDPAA